MSAAEIHALAGALLVAIGLYGITVRPHLLVKVIGFNVMSTGVFLLLVTLSPTGPDGRPDPVPQAMVLTGIVVAVSATAFALALVRRLERETDDPRLPEDA
jgi:multicomponent Na+:H+ antiporter subunit C